MAKSWDNLGDQWKIWGNGWEYAANSTGIQEKWGLKSQSGDFSNSNAGIVVISWDMGIYSGKFTGLYEGLL